ncbi:hypothetical protein DS834_05400 [Lactobacillus bombicola]|jgi:hypothetical protein|uniref:Uncharacterized protein n=1 Tax=Lactobacillus bombicola TaxID=1505723 RepID=A0ABX9LTV5_9LACO|nr:hypothetical protein [Lactobacillus bombicola]RHW50717.1 hypothetical protein DS834_05400 [Lactobacillus bombicola]
MKFNKKIITLAVAGITAVSPIISQSALVLADTTNQVTNNTAKTDANTATTDNSKASQDNKVTAPNADAQKPKEDNKVVAPNPNADAQKPKEEAKTQEPKAKLIKTNAKWSKKHKTANKYYNAAIKKGRKLSKLKRLNLYTDTLKHFSKNHASYAKKYRAYLKAEINWLKPIVEKEQQAKIVNPLPDVPTDHPVDTPSKTDKASENKK